VASELFHSVNNVFITELMMPRHIQPGASMMEESKPRSKKIRQLRLKRCPVPFFALQGRGAAPDLTGSSEARGFRSKRGPLDAGISEEHFEHDPPELSSHGSYPYAQRSGG
jgi:hypothetical protein